MGTSSMPTLAQTLQANLLNLLVVDDERPIRDILRRVAQSLGFSVFAGESRDQVNRIIGAQNIDVVLLDLKLPGGASGLEILQEIKTRRPDCEVIVITGYGTVQSAVEAMKVGAYDYVTKPFDLEELRLLLERVASHLKLARENRLFHEKIKANQGFGGIIGRSPEMAKLYRLIARVSCSGHPVLIQGESGTGKELVARAIHFTGPFRDRAFIPVDCESLAPNLIESELFGYLRGAFTGAVRSKEGLMSIAEGGTVFLDEISELPTDFQSKLLRAIQEQEVRPVGATKSIPLNVRILAATNGELKMAVEDGKFRQDLYLRLNVVTLKIPPLRERKEDIPLLATHLLEKLARSTGVQSEISDEAMNLMLAYDWPGNVRELEYCLERACALKSEQVIQLSDLPIEIREAQRQSTGGILLTSRILTMAELEKQAILGSIDKLHGDKLTAAKLLGIGKTTLYRKLKQYAAEN
jgi:DNA-binding NtrC family response regulator